MQPFDLLREQLGKTVPFAAHVGVDIVEVGEGTATARIADRAETKNHIGSQHAGALFTVAEAASGAAMAGALFPVLMQVRPVAAQSNVRFLKIAEGPILAEARIEQKAPESLEELEAQGKVRFPVEVSLSNEAGHEVAAMSVDWHVSKGR
ncbi:MAG: YiiD C-terminal domain-containing protein [Pseudomonadota bacterium]